GWVPRLGLTSLCVVVCAAVLFSLAVLRLLECDWVRRFEVGLCIGISFGSAAFSAPPTEAPPRPSSRRGRIPRFACRPELVTLALCLRGKASPFWIMLLLVLGAARSSDDPMLSLILRTPHRRAQITCPLLARSGMPKNASDVAIGGKADMAYCSANVRF